MLTIVSMNVAHCSQEALSFNICSIRKQAGLHLYFFTSLVRHADVTVVTNAGKISFVQTLVDI